MDMFVNTRPLHEATFDVGMPSVHLPLLAMTALPLSAQEDSTLHAFIQGDIDTVVVVSKEAVRHALSWLSAHNIHHARDLPHRPTFIAVGAPTKEALAQFGGQVITPKEFGLEMSNEGMIQMPIFGALCAGDKVMMWRGAGGRRLLHDELVKQGIEVLGIAFYERHEPTDSAQRFEAFYQHTPKDTRLFVLISSGASLTVWHKFDRGIHPMVFLTLGERLTKLTQEHYPRSQVVRVADLSPKHIFDTLTQLTT